MVIKRFVQPLLLVRLQNLTIELHHSLNLIWRGFGDAVLRAEPFVKEAFIVHAGDSLILSIENEHMKRMCEVHDRYRCDATFLVQEVQDPRSFGVINGTEIEEGVYSVSNVIEKPENPPINLAITALYVFTPLIFTALKSVPEGLNGELQLTDGIQKLIRDGIQCLCGQA
jgi:UTP--glucose-1-phosphate uridylyltransferase